MRRAGCSDVGLLLLHQWKQPVHLRVVLSVLPSLPLLRCVGGKDQTSVGWKLSCSQLPCKSQHIVQPTNTRSCVRLCIPTACAARRWFTLQLNPFAGHWKVLPKVRTTFFFGFFFVHLGENDLAAQFQWARDTGRHDVARLREHEQRACVPARCGTVSLRVPNRDCAPPRASIGMLGAVYFYRYFYLVMAL